MTSLTPCGWCWRFSIVALGVLCISAGVCMYLNWIDMFTRLRGKEMALSPTSPSYSGWKVSPLALNFDVYLFNWTNPEEFRAGSKVKPRFEQLGPYRFQESPDKVDIEWHNHNHSVSFRKKATFHFDAAGSNGTLADKITTVNTVSHAAALRGRDLSYFGKLSLQTVLRMWKEDVTITKTAGEWMFEGYQDAMVTTGKVLSMFSNDIVVPYDRIGWFYQRNGSVDFEGHFNMHTGADDIQKMGQIHTWNHMTHNRRFEGQCGEVKGSMGEFFPSNLTPKDSISMYLPNLCRSVPLDYTETTKIHGITGYRFSAGERAVDNGTLFPEAKCFCVNGKCEASGVINISPCKFNSSVYMSYPHFYKADPSYLEAIDGLAPDPEKHEFFMTLEPNAGVVMDVGGGFQANYLLEPVKGIEPFEDIPRIFIPLMWCEERVRITPEIASDVALVPFIVLLGQIATGVLLAGGVILICWYPTKCITQLCHDPKSKTALINPLVHPKGITLPSLKKPNGGLPLLEYRGSYTTSSKSSATDSLLGNAVDAPTNVLVS